MLDRFQKQIRKISERGEGGRIVIAGCDITNLMWADSNRTQQNSTVLNCTCDVFLFVLFLFIYFFTASSPLYYSCFKQQAWEDSLTVRSNHLLGFPKHALHEILTDWAVDRLLEFRYCLTVQFISRVWLSYSFFPVVRLSVFMLFGDEGLGGWGWGGGDMCVPPRGSLSSNVPLHVHSLSDNIYIDLQNRN